ncbi:MAG: RNA 2',3'-cyclic phosphodiesterase [Candidatus Hermodarchaeota archaeon]
MFRLFISVDVKDQLILKAIELAAEEIKQLKSVRLVNSSQLHFTLKFLGDTPEDKVSVINSALSAIQWIRFDLTLQGLGVFPKPSFPRVVWVGVSSGQQLIKDLAQKVDKALLKEGFPKEKRPFSPHLTIGRFKSKNFSNKLLLQILNNFQDVEFGQLSIQEINLKKSTLTPKGPIYETLSTFSTPSTED